ncbi:hypothetical protein NC651_023403 [Populus alba x Populus x berolinensis]|nr:hypothetical protein NC651_023403 [Populus alba x Populus x berolinensis]
METSMGLPATQMEMLGFNNLSHGTFEYKKVRSCFKKLAYKWRGCHITQQALHIGDATNIKKEMLLKVDDAGNGIYEIPPGRFMKYSILVMLRILGVCRQFQDPSILDFEVVSSGFDACDRSQQLKSNSKRL